MKRIEIKDLNAGAFLDLHAKPALLSAGNETKANTMTIGWGMVGTMWSKPSVLVAVRQSRYTKEFIDGNEFFSISLFEDNSKELIYLGRHSGRDEDKMAAVGFHFENIEGVPFVSEAKSVIICRKSMNMFMGKDAILDKKALELYYPDSNPDYHDIYFGEIIAVYSK